MAPNLVQSLGALAFLITSVIASPLSKPEDLKARAGTYAITGTRDGGIQPRLEIRTLAADPIQWNLFLLAMIEYQRTDQDELLSYYQIGGIHGFPLIPWDGVQASGNADMGYCTHGSNLFGPWHRPYLALHEQQIHNWGVRIAQQFEDNSEAYRMAATTLRLPYWDWAANPPNNGPILPHVLSNPTASVIYPDGTKATVDNPLYSYRFHPLDPEDFQNAGAVATWNNTLRRPTSYAPDATSQNDQVEMQLEANFRNFRNQLMVLFANYQPYNHVSNKGSGRSGYGNIESTHDVVHVLLGGTSYSGHMSIVPVAAFDPIFWFHHANVDKFLSLWQALYPDTYVDPAVQSSDTFTITRGSVEDQNSVLTPFHKNTNGNFYTSADVRNPETLGYSYPEIINHPSNRTLKQTITALYGGRAASSFSRRQPTSDPSLPRDYIVKIDIPWTALNSSYSVAVFLGKSTAQPSAWARDPSFVGMHTTLYSHRMAPNDVITSSNVHLSDALLEKHQEGALEDLHEETIVKYLRENLEWRAERGGREVDLTSLEGAVVTTQSIDVAAPAAPGTFDKFKWVGEFKTFPGVCQPGSPVPDEY
ncbi:hypothetical protein NHQ30_007029 [Ciborinia camelliae]|nr:hypothetical protein NHQ30_007029 [Ciborinia camelliae]